MNKLLGVLVLLGVMLFVVPVFAAGYEEHPAQDTQGDEYWTKERMEKAKPMEKVLPGAPKDSKIPAGKRHKKEKEEKSDSSESQSGE
jgi:hypothetical protein